MARYPGVSFSQFTGAEMLAKKHDLTRAELDEFAYASHVKAAAAQKAGYFAREIAPIEVTLENGEKVMHESDEGVRPDASLEKMKTLLPLAEGGVLTAASSSQICDGAAAVLVANERGLKAAGLVPRARIHTISVVGDDPVIMLEGPIPATKKALARAGMKIEDIDLYEVMRRSRRAAGVGQGDRRRQEEAQRQRRRDGARPSVGATAQVITSCERARAHPGALRIARDLRGGGTANARSLSVD